MSYVLDGIRTSLEVRDHFLRCPCGYALLYGDHMTLPPHHWAALRFHYAHCPAARARAELHPQTLPVLEQMIEVADPHVPSDQTEIAQRAVDFLRRCL